jgi:hypothetical protein
MSIETRQPDIPAQRTSIEHSRVEKARYIGQLAWIRDAREDALRRGDVEKANELLHMLETASQ